MATQFTPSIALPYPPTTDNNDTVGAVQALATTLDAIVEGSYTQAEINAFAGATQLWPGRKVYNSTRGCYQNYIGGVWLDDQALVINMQVGSYVLVLADANSKVVGMNVAGANNLSVPTDAAVPFPIGTVINALQYGAGQTSVIAVTPGTTNIRFTPGNKLRTQYSTATLLKLAANEWLLNGDIVP